MKNLLIFLLFLFCSCSMYNDGLLVHYSFNGNANNSVNRKYSGKVWGAILVQDRFNNKNSAYEFDGIDDYIEIPHFGKIVPSEEISVSLWVKSSILKAQFQIMLCPDDDRFAISIDYSHNGVNYTFWDFGWKGEEGNAPGRLYDSKSYLDFSWHHYVFISSILNSTMKIYKDGNLIIEENDPCILLNNKKKSIRIGSGDSRYYYKGVIDEIKIYKRALTDEHVKVLFNSN